VVGRAANLLAIELGEHKRGSDVLCVGVLPGVWVGCAAQTHWGAVGPRGAIGEVCRNRRVVGSGDVVSVC